MGDQKDIAAKIVDRGGDYVLSLKDNHPTLHAAVAESFTAALEADAPPPSLRRHSTVENYRGRAERREYWAVPVPESLPGRAGWKRLTTLVMMLRVTETDGAESAESAEFSYYSPACRRTSKRWLK